MNPHKSHNYTLTITDQNGLVWNPLFAQQVTQPERKINTVQHNENGVLVDTAGLTEITKAKVTFLVGLNDDSEKLESWFAAVQGRGATTDYTGTIRVTKLDFDGVTVIEEQAWYGCFPTNIKSSDLNKTQKAENSTKEVEFSVKEVKPIV